MDFSIKRIARFYIAVMLFALIAYQVIPVQPIPEGVSFHNPSIMDVVNSFVVIGSASNPVINGDFSDGLNGWTISGNVIVIDGKAVLNNSDVYGSGYQSILTQTFTPTNNNLTFDLTVIKRTYTLSCLIIGDGSGSIYNSNNCGSGHYDINISGYSSIEVRFRAYNGLSVPSSEIFTVDNVSNSPPPPINYDPSGYIKDSAGNLIYNAFVNISNATFSATDYSDINGYWNVDIFKNDTYSYSVKKSGYITLTGTQAFTIGGIDNNFTIVPSGGVISGTITTNKASTGSIAVLGDLDQIKQSKKASSQTSSGGSLSVPGAPDGQTYFIRLLDVDSISKQVFIDIYKNNIIISDTFSDCQGGNGCTLDQDIESKFKIESNLIYDTYLVITPLELFNGGGEIVTAKFIAGYEMIRKPATTITQFIVKVVDLLAGVVDGFANWTIFSTDGTNTDVVTFNSTAGKDVYGSQVFDVGTSGDIFNFYTVITAESTTAMNGILELGYTDNTILSAPGYTDTLYITNLKPYRGSTEDFKAMDANGDHIIKVWFKMDASGSSFAVSEFYLMALGATTNQPLIGANIYYSGTYHTLSVSPTGQYLLNVPLGTNFIQYYLTGYESKNVTHAFTVGDSLFTNNVILNSTNKTINTTIEYIYIDPNPISLGNQAYSYYKTLDKTSSFGGYEISICPLQGGDCTQYPVGANIEDNIPIDTFPIGEYTASLTGYADGFLDWNRDTIVQTNFTVTSNVPSINWLASSYCRGDMMYLNINIPSGYNIVTVNYPNGTNIISNNYSASSTLYNLTFQTKENVSVDAYPNGIYTATISGGASKITELLSVACSAYNLSAPLSALWGQKFVISYSSPKQTTLYITNNNGSTVYAEQVIGIKSLQINTGALSNIDDILKIKLILGGVVVANTSTIITHTGTGDGSNPNEPINTLGIVDLLQNNTFWALLLTVGMMLAVGALAGKNSKDNSAPVVPMAMAGFLGIAVTAMIGWMPLWIVGSVILVVIVAFSWQQATKTSGGS